MEDNLKKNKMEDDLKKNKMEDDLKTTKKLSWDWLSSLRFLK
jgi:hypothetical protein